MNHSELKEQFPEIKENEILAQYTTFRIGGRARYFLIVRTREVLMKALQICKKRRIPWFILGGGSNVLISSLGFQGLVIKNEMRESEVKSDCIWAESGTILATILKLAKDHGLQGLTRLSGIPGTFGAAVRGNVGVPGCEIGDFLVQATILDKDLQIKTVTRDYFDYSYRYSRLKYSNEIIIDATICLEPGGDPEVIGSEMLEIIKSRKEKQPWGASPGSYFKNPKEYAAGYLIDQVHGKGLAVGGAFVSEKHGNFLMNSGNASSMDVQKLAEKLRRKVLYEFGIMLSEEVEFVGRKKWSGHVIDHPVLKWFVVSGLIIAGIVGIIFPILPGVIFLIIAVYIVSPRISERVAVLFVRLRRYIGMETKNIDIHKK